MRGSSNDITSRANESLSTMNMSSNKTKSTPSPQQFQQITRFDKQQLPKIKYETSKKFIPSPELIVDESQSSSSESNEKYIIKSHHYGIPVT